jgi:hypothetical protein
LILTGALFEFKRKILWLSEKRKYRREVVCLFFVFAVFTVFAVAFFLFFFETKQMLNHR